MSVLEIAAAHGQGWRQVGELFLAFALTSVIGLERQLRGKSAGLRTIADQAGHTVAATSGTSDLDELNKINKARDLHILVMLRRTHGEAFSMVETGQASAFVMDHSILSGLVADSDHPDEYVISQETFSDPEPYGIAMPLGDTAFKNAVNQALGKLFAVTTPE